MNTRIWKIVLAFALVFPIIPVVAQLQRSGEASELDTHHYFPVGAFDTSSSEGDFKATWYACTLIALKEPSLFALRNDEAAEVYRFLWLPSLSHPISVRLAIKPDGSGSIVTRSVDKNTGLLPLKIKNKTIPDGTGNLTIDTANDISSVQVQDVLQRLQELQFWYMGTTEEEQTPPSKNGTSASQTPKVTIPPLDGARWILEGVRGGRYHVVDRWSPKDDAYSRLCKYFLMLGKVEEKNLY